MAPKDYNRFLALIKEANYISPASDATEALKAIYDEMVAMYGKNESDVEYLYRQFRYYI